MHLRYRKRDDNGDMALLVLDEARRVIGLFNPESPATEVVRLELQPGDMTRYVVWITRLESMVMFSMETPSMCAFERRVGDCSMSPFDRPLCDLNPCTAAILADVANAVFGHDPSYYDFRRSRPKEKFDADE